MILGLLAMVIANAATLLGARSLLNPVKTGKPAVDVVLLLILRLLLITAVVLVAGAAGALTPLVLGAAGVAALAVLLARGAHKGLLPPARPEWPRWVAVVAALLALRLLIQVWFFAPHVGDTISYHLPKVAEWVRAGALVREAGSDPRASFPAGFELIETWWVLFLHHDVLIEMAGLEFLLLGAAGAYALARELGWTPRGAAISALVFAMTPGLHLQATSCLNDGPVAALLVATTALIVARAHPLLLLIPIGLGAGIKGTFLYALPGLALMFWMYRKEAPAPEGSPKAAAALALVALGAGATWYLRNWALYGSPVYPLNSEGMKSMVSGATMQRLGPSFRALRENLSCFLDIRVYDRFQAADALCTGNFNWGAAAFALGAPALIPLLRNEPALRRVAIGLVASTLCVFTLVELDPWYARFVLFVPLLPALALGRFWEHSRGVAFLGTLALALGFLSTCLPALLPPQAAARLAAQSWRSRAASPPPMLPEIGAPLGCLSEDFGAGYALYGPDFSRRVVYLRETTVDELLARIDAEKIGVIYVDGALKKSASMLEEARRRGRLEPFVRDGWKGYVVRPGR